MKNHTIRIATLALLVPTLAAAKPPASDAQWTLHCQRFTGPAHAQSAKQMKDALLKASKMKDWYLISNETETSLYYGFYRTFDDPKDPDTVRAQNDRKAIAFLVDQTGNRLFQSCVFEPLPGTDPEAPPEWDLRNAKGYFSLAIAAYMDSPQRKQFAVDAVRKAREEGVEAYYYHGEHVSEVCIGAWSREAVREQESAGGRTSDPNQPLLVTTTPLPSNLKELRTKDTGERVKVLSPRPEYLDPTLIAARAKYQTHSINGETVVRKQTIDGQERTQEDPSFLVLIPSREEVVKRDPALEQKAVELGVTQQQAAAPKRGAGQLKSIGQ